MAHLNHAHKKPGQKKKTKLKKRKFVYLLLIVVLVFFLGAGIRYMMIGQNIAAESEWTEALETEEEHEYTNMMIAVINPNNILEFALIMNKQDDVATYNTLFIPGETYLNGSEEELELFLESYQGKDNLEEFIKTTEDAFGLTLHEMVVFDMQVFDQISEQLDFSHDVSLKDYKNEIMQSETTSDQENIHIDLKTEIQTFIEQTKAHTGMLTTPRIRGVVKEHLITNLSWEPLESFATDYIIQEKNETFYRLPGQREAAADYYYLLPEREQLEMVVDQYFAEEVEYIDEADITVEVLNGCGEPGLAEDVASKLEARDFQVVRTGNADHYDYPYSQVISRSETTEAAKQVALEVNRSDLLVDVEEEHEAMVTVIVGENYLEE